MSGPDGGDETPALRRYRRLLRLLPRRFRAAHSDEMTELFADVLAGAGESGRTARARVWVSAVLDVLWQSVRLRVSGTASRGPRKGRTAAQGPFVARDALMDGVLLDLRHAARSLAHAPVYSIVTVVTLALGIGATTSIFGAVDAVLFRPPAHVEDPEEIVTIYTSDYSGPAFGSSSHLDFEDFVAGAPALESAATVSIRSVNVPDGTGVSRTLTAELVSGSYFEMLGASPFGGRWFTAEEGRWDSGVAVGVLGHGAWTRIFGADPSVVGRELRISGQAVTIVGIAPAGLGGGGYLPAMIPDIWLPPSTEVLLAGEGAFTNRGSRGRLIRGRLADGATIETLEVQLDAVAASLHAQYPDVWTDVNGDRRRVTATPDARMSPQLATPAALFSTLLLAAMGLVLLIACANVATLTLVRGRRRSRELAVRSALGAGRARLARQALAETGLLCVLGGLGGTLLAGAVMAYVERVRPAFSGMSFSIDLSRGPRVLVFALAVTAVTILAIGVLPALRAARPNLVPMMKREGSTPGRRLRRLSARSGLVIAQVAASIVLLVGGGLLLQSIRSATSLDLGFEVDGIATLSLDMGPGGYENEEAHRFFEELRTRVQARPGVQRAALVDVLPLRSARRRGISIDGYAPPQGEDMEFDFFRVGSGFLETVGMEVLEGRPFGEEDGADALRTVMVNRAFAERFWPDRSPVGRGVSVGGEAATVIGVVVDADYRSIGEAPRPAFFLALEQIPSTAVTLVARTTPGREGDLLPTLRTELRALDAQVPISTIGTMSDVVATALLPQRVGAVLLVVAGGLGLFLSVLGLYGVIAYVVSERTREMGVRMALGAPAKRVLRMVLGRGLVLSLVGVGVGSLLALGVTRFLQSLLFGVAPTDPLVFSVASALVVGVSLLASYVPARRAASVDPAVTLRED